MKRKGGKAVCFVYEFCFSEFSSVEASAAGCDSSVFSVFSVAASMVISCCASLGAVGGWAS